MLTAYAATVPTALRPYPVPQPFQLWADFWRTISAVLSSGMPEEEAARLATLWIQKPTDPLRAAQIRFNASMQEADEARPYKFESAEEALAMELELQDLDTDRLPPDFKQLRVWGRDGGIDP